MKTDIKHGFIVTYFKSSDESEKLLSEMIDTLSKENFYLVLAAHSIVPTEIQEKCDYFIYESLNISDDRKYSHGVAESSLIEMSLLHLKYQGIEWTFKTCYDIILNDISIFSEVTKDYNYNLVTCNWGDHFICTHTFFTNIDFILNNITFYKTVEEMFKNSNILELCWQNDIVRKNLKDQLFIYPSKSELFGRNNKIDVVGFNYHNVEFWYEDTERKFWIKNNGIDYNAELRIFDYYSDTCIYENNNFFQSSGETHWVIPMTANYLDLATNGFYLEIYLDNKTIRKNILIKDFRLKDQNYKKFRKIKRKEVKFIEYCELANFEIYKSFNFKIDEIRNFVDVGACYGFASIPFINKGCKVYMIEPDENNLQTLNTIWSKNSKIKIIEKVISDINGKLEFYIEDNLSVVSSIFEYNALGSNLNRRKLMIDSITPNNLFENYIEEEYIDLIKIDIEGAEYKFFDTINEENIKRCQRFIVEFHNNNNYEVMSILKRLAKSGFRYKLQKWNYDDSDFIVENKMGIIYAEKI